jgi:hypothetical protein
MELWYDISIILNILMFNGEKAMFILMLLMIFYITIPMILIGVLFGIFLLQASPMRLSDLRNLLGFYRSRSTLVIIEQVVNRDLEPRIENLLSISGHYIVSHMILSYYLLLLSVFLQLLPWKSKCFPYFNEHFILANVSNAQNEEEVNNGNFYHGFYSDRNRLPFYNTKKRSECVTT